MELRLSDTMKLGGVLFLLSVNLKKKERLIKMSSFHVDGRISIKLEYELAVRLGEFIIKSGTLDKQIIALGYKLYNMDEENAPAPVVQKWQNNPSEESSFASEWSEAESTFEDREAKVASIHDKVKRARMGNKIRWGHE